MFYFSSVLKGHKIRSLTLVLLPGLDGTGILFQPLVAALPANIRAVVVDYPAHERLTYNQLLPIVLAALPTSEPFILMGESFSGPLVVMAAATRRDNLVGVILCATFVTRPIPWIGWAIPLLANSMVFQLFPLAQKVKTILGGYSNPQLRSLFSQIHERVRPEMIAYRVRQVFQIDVCEQLRMCDVPMLYIAAAKDRVVPAHNMRTIQRIVPAMKVVTIKCSHGILQTRPVEAAWAIANFSASLVPISYPVST